MSKRQPKSGSKGKSSGKPTPARRSAALIAPEIREMVRAALVVANGFPVTSPLHLQTVLQLCEKVIKQYGTDVCRALVREMIPHKAEPKGQLFIHAALKSLTTLGQLDVAQALMAETHLRPASCIELYASMGYHASEADRAEILLSMRALLLKVKDSGQRMDSLYRIFLLSRLPEDHHLLREHSLAHIDGKMQLSVAEFGVLLGVASIMRNQSFLVRVIEIMDTMRHTVRLNGAEQRLFEILERWDPQRLSELADALPHTIYVTAVRRLAQKIRDGRSTEPEAPPPIP